MPQRGLKVVNNPLFKWQRITEVKCSINYIKRDWLATVDQAKVCAMVPELKAWLNGT